MDESVQLPPKLLSRISIAKKELEHFSDVRIVSHYDADGISSGGVLCNAFIRANKKFHATITKNLTENLIKEVGDGCECLVLADMGSSYLKELEALDCKVIVLDHHAPPIDSEKVVHVNPHLAGIDGMTSASASAVCMLLAITMDEANWPLLPIAFAGIAGDRQTVRGLSGLNQWLFEKGAARKIVEARPGSLVPDGLLLRGLISSTDPYIIGVSGNENGAKALLKEAAIDENADSESLNEQQRMKLSSLIALRLVKQGTPLTTLDEVVTPSYYFPGMKITAGEFAGLLNACGRSKNEGVGLALTLGDASAKEEARRLREEYSKEVLTGLDIVQKNGVQKGENIQYFYNDNSGLSGILCGVTMQYFGDRDKPTITLSVVDKDVRISSRGTFEILEKGVDLALALKESSAKLGGVGGGHRIASGATVPVGKDKEFLQVLDRIIGEQKAAKAATAK